MSARLLLALGGLAMVAGPASARDAAHPTVVELYQSQGCSSCPPAIHNINLIAERPDILALTFAVTYWDQLGWKDTFAKPEFTARQWDYAKAGSRGQVATPQTIVNGRAVTNGGNGKQLIATIAAADRGTSGPAVSVQGNQVTIGAAPAKTAATIWLVRYDPRSLEVPIRAGENGGKTLAHRNVVRSMAPLGTWRGERTMVALPAAVPNLRSAILVQAGKGGPIVAASRI